MIDTLITALSKELELSAEEIADTIWLALQIQESQSESTATQNSKNDLSQPSSKNEDLEGETLPEKPTQTSDSGESASKQSPDEQKAGIYPRNQQETLFKSELSFKVPDAPSLREPLTLARALKPLMRRIPSGTTLVLDESATTQRIANEGLWLPVLRPTLEPWLDLELVVDEGISMQIWRHTIRELERLLKNYGIFRDVRVWGLIADNLEQVQIRRGIGATAKNQSPRSPAELIDPSGRRLVLVVSDCVSSLWRDGKVTTTLEIWAKQGSMAIVQMLPKWLWKRTALGRASEVRLQGLNPGDFNQKLIAKEVSLWDELEEMRGVKVPVFTLEPDKVATWAQMLSGKGGIWTLGYVFKLDPIPVNKGRDLFNLNYGQQNAEQRVQAFRVTASPMARKLAGLLAAAPAISLPIVRLIQRTLLKDSQQVHVAEVFLGGLLRPLSEINAETNPDYVQYEFMDGVRELLVDSVPSGYVLNVVDEVSKDVAKNLGLSLEDFAAVLRNPQQVRDSEIAGGVGYFATVTAQVLRRLGGEYVKVAEELELNDSVKAKNLSTNISTSETFQHGYALLIGVGECLYKPLSLPVTVKDTQAIYATLVDQDLCAYPDDPEHIRVLNNQQATRFDILEGLQWLKQKAEEDSEATVFVYYSGHGCVDKTDNHYYLLPHDTKASTLVASALSDEFMDGIRQSALSADDFTERIRQIQSERLLVMIDAAHSGNMATFRHSEEVGEEFLNDSGNSQNVSPFKTFISSLRQGKGRMIFTSSQGDQKSWLKDGSISLYTFHFLEALKGVANQPGDTTIKISNLVSYLSETVPQTAKKLHNVNQTPCFDVDGSDFVIAKLRGGKGLPNVPLLSEKEIDYTKLCKLLITQNWKEADEETTMVMLQLSSQQKRGWLDEEDMKKVASIDLQTIDQLWLKYSNGRFGYSVQKQVWLSVGGQLKYYDDEIYKKFGETVGWYIKNQDKWRLWDEHIFTLDAPQGHLPSQQKEILSAIIDRVATGKETEGDIAFLRQVLSADRQIVTQLGIYNVNIGQGQGIQIGDRTYLELNEEAIQALIRAIQKPSTVLSQFQSLIQDKTEGFVGREYVFDAIQTFIQENKKGYFTIIGDPGQGKSAILAKYVQNTECIAHFNVQLQRPNRADQFLESVCKQLVARYQLPYDPLPSNATQDGEFLGHLLDEVAQRRNGQPIIIAVDALDEVDSGSYRDANILCLPPYLPDGVYFIMTRRRGVEVPFTTYAPQQIISLLDYDIDSQRDVRLYIQNRVNGSENLSQQIGEYPYTQNRVDDSENLSQQIDEYPYTQNRVDDSENLSQQIDERQEKISIFTDKIADKSENNFMYLRYVLLDIEKGLYKDLSLERFPQGLQGYYDFHWRCMGMTANPLPDAKIKIIYILGEVKQPVSRQQICDFSGEDTVIVQTVLNEWKPFLHEVIMNGEKRYRIYNNSFRNFLHRKYILDQD
jgi:hypothetical protein